MSELNWIGAEWCSSEYSFSLARAGRRSSWPRSSAEEALAAVASAAAAHEPWLALAPERRADGLRRLANALTRCADSWAGLSVELGPPRGMQLFGAIDTRPQEVPPQQASGAEPALAGTTLWRPHWSELVRGAGRALIERAQRGSLVWLADPLLPELAAICARALEQAGLPAGLVNVIHDDTDTALRAALCDARVVAFAASAAPREAARLRRLAQELRPSGAKAGSESSSPSAHFGAGVIEPSVLDIAVESLVNASHQVRRDADPAREARDILLRAWGLECTWSGQLPGQIARVLCHQRCFSELSEELLALLEENPPQLLPAIDQDLADYLGEVREMGLDEGAALIYESQGEASGSHPGTGAASLGPLIFTNVEPSMRLLQLRRAAPVLVLMRVDSDASGAALARELDRPLERVSRVQDRAGRRS